MNDIIKEFEIEGEIESEKGFVFFNKGEFSEALKCYDNAISLNENNCLYWFNKGQMLSILGKNRDAIVAYDKSIELGIVRKDVQFFKALCYYLEKDYEITIKILNSIYNNFYDNKKFLFLKGVCYNKLQNYENAILYYNRFLYYDNQNLQVLFNKLECLLHLENYSDSLLQCEILLKLNVGDKKEELFYQKSVCNIKLNNFEESIICINIALEKYPNNNFFLINKFYSLLKLKKYEELIDLCNKILETDFKNNNVLLYKSLALYNQKLYEESLNLSKLTIEMILNEQNKNNYRNNLFRINVGFCLFKLKKYDEADDIFTQLLNEKEHKFIDVIYGKILVSTKKKDFNTSIQYYVLALEINPNNTILLNNIAVQLNEIGKYYEAIKYLDNCISNNSNLPNPWKHKAYSLLKIDKLEEALININVALRINPNYLSAKTLKIEITQTFINKINSQK